MSRFLRENWLLAGLFALLLAAALWLGASAAMRAIYWADPRHVDVPLRPWMTPRYVGRSYDLPPEVVREALELAPGEEAPRRIGRLAAERGVTLEALTEAVRAAAAAHRAGAE